MTELTFQYGLELLFIELNSNGAPVVQETEHQAHMGQWLPDGPSY
jgi:hypothetical protein